MRWSSAIFFDLDGVLVDSTAAIALSVNAALAAAGLSPEPEARIRALIGVPLHDIFETLGCGSGEALDGYVASYRAEYERVSLSHTVVTDGIAAALEALARQHLLVVTTTKPLEFARPILERVGLADFFHGAFGPSLAARSESKLKTVERARAALEPVRPVGMVGDRSFDIASARHLGITAVGVTWGYGSRDELVGAGADVLVGEPAELLDVEWGRRAPLEPPAASSQPG